jgi:phosphoglycerate dehydrogenase-like enzyme
MVQKSKKSAWHFVERFVKDNFRFMHHAEKGELLSDNLLISHGGIAMNADKRRPRILICDQIHPAGIELLQAHFDVEVKTGLNQAALCDTVPAYDGLVARSATQITAEVIKHGLNLKIIGRAGSGLDNVDVEAARAANITVVNCPDANTLAVAEHALALLLALARRLPQAVSSMKAGRWEKSGLIGEGLSGKTLGIVGFGRIGRQVARRAQAFGMKILVNQRQATPELQMEQGVMAVDLHDLLSQADFVTLHVPFKPETHNLIGAAELALMKPTAYLINTARGGVVDEAALLVALQDGRLAGAALDVFAQEPAPNPALVQHERVIATPHIAASTQSAQEAAAVTVAEQMVEFFQQVEVESVLPLRVVPMERVFAHENVDMKRVNRLAKRLDEEGRLGNPPIVTAVGDGRYMVLDGATRSAAMAQLGFPHAIVQVIRSEDGLGLKTWYHTIRQIREDALIALLTGLPLIQLEPILPGEAAKAMFEYGGLCYLHTVSDRAYLVQPALGANRLDALNQLTETYIEAAHVDRTLNSNIISLKSEVEGFTAVVIFPEYTVAQVIQTTLESGRLFPAGITRFIIPGRVLRLNADLSVLRSKEMSLREKNRWLHEQLLLRQAKGGIRRYDEPVVLLDE